MRVLRFADLASFVSPLRRLFVVLLLSTSVEDALRWYHLVRETSFEHSALLYNAAI